jgi:hypothetical protein
MSASLIDPRPKQHKWERFRGWCLGSATAVAIALLSATFTGWQAYEAHKARVEAHNAAEDARANAKKQADKQSEDVQEAREAAERSADTAQKLADGMDRSAKAAEKSALLAGSTVAAMRDITGVARNQLQQSQAHFELEQQPQFSISTEISGEMNVNAGKQTILTSKVIYSGKAPARDCELILMHSLPLGLPKWSTDPNQKFLLLLISSHLMDS